MEHPAVRKEGNPAMTCDFETSPCEPLVLVPPQMFGRERWDPDTSGARALMLAVLDDAVRCVEEGRRQNRFRTRRLAAEAEDWMRCEHGDWPFSFVNICEVLGFDAPMVRARLLASAGEAAIGRRKRRRVHTLIRSRTTRRDAESGPTLRVACSGSPASVGAAEA